MTHQPLSRGETTGGTTSGLTWALHRLAAALAADDALVARRLGLSPTEYLALKHLMAAEQTLGPAELSRRLGMSTGSVNALINRLRTRGYVNTGPHPSDRRRLLVSVSPACQAAVLEVLRPLGERIDRLADQMTDHDAAIIVRFLEDTARVHQDHFRKEEARGF